MILPRADIFIVFSSDYKHVLDVVRDEINNAYEQDAVAVKASFLSNDNLLEAGATNLNDLLENKLQHVEGAIILYSPDIELAGNLYPKPNLTFETGMLFQLLPKEKIMVFKFPGTTLFSDIQGIAHRQLSISISKETSPESETEIRHFVRDFIIRNFRKLDRNPLVEFNYVPQYPEAYPRKMLSRDELKVLFFDQLNLLDEKEQRIVYIAERFFFTGLIRSIYDRLRETINEMITQSDQDSIQALSLMVLKNTLEYLHIRQEQRTADLDGREFAVRSFRYLIGDWRKLKEQIEILELEQRINPIILILYYDYYGLTLHKYLELKKGDQNNHADRIDKMEQAEAFFNKACDYAKKVDRARHPNYWQGYVEFEQARLALMKYENQFQVDADDANLKDILDDCLHYFDEVVSIRRNWFNHGHPFPNSINLQLQCEYFYAGIDYLNVMTKYGGDDDCMDWELLKDQFNTWSRENNNSLNDLINSVSQKISNAPSL